MKGVVLAGGLGTRLQPLTRITNKHLLPIYNKPMVYFAIEALAEAGLDDIMLVCGGNHAGEFLRLLGNGIQFGLKMLNYTYQENEGGIAEALGLTEEFVGEDKVVVLLGDNIFGKGIKSYIEAFRNQEHGARIVLTEVDNPEEYGVVEFEGQDIVRIIEKPEIPPSKMIVTGFYMYDSRVFKIIRSLKPSQRGELEITDVNNAYLKNNTLEYSIMKGWWADAGSSIEAYYQTIKRVRKKTLENGQ